VLQATAGLRHRENYQAKSKKTFMLKNLHSSNIHFYDKK